MTKKLTAEEKAANKAARQAARGVEAKPAKKAKAAKVAKEKPEKKAKTDRKKKDAPAGAGHNSAGLNPALKEIFTEYQKLEADGKVIAKAKRDLRARAKEEHSVPAANFNHEIKMQKLDNEARVTFENGISDLKNMLGIQLSLNLHRGEEEGEEGDYAPNPAEAAARQASIH